MCRSVVAIALAFTAWGTPSLAGPGAKAAAANTHIMLFNLTPAGTYNVRRNGASAGAAVANPSGVLVFETNASGGDRFDFLLAGINPVSPARPGSFAATGDDQGCVQGAWNPPSPSDYVTDYSLLWGKIPGAYTDSVSIAGADIAKGSKWVASHCGFATGSYVFALRAHNAFDRWSPLSAASTTNIANQDTQADVIAPTISQRTPAAGSTGVARNANIFFVTADDKTGVDPASIVITLDGTARAFTTAPTSGGLAVQCDPPSDFAPDADVSVTLSVADKASPPNVASRTYTFHTGTSIISDTDAPSVGATSPATGAQGVDPRPTIEVLITDDGLGVDLNSIAMEVNGEAVDFTVAGTPASARVRYRPSTGFAAESTVSVHVTACDRAQPPHCATALDYQFTVRAENAALEGPGAIVPNGYWANDPSRPLEIRNLPSHWSVRIFDTSGASVRRHENDAEGATWSWNFKNDEGQRVAPALYLVRVTDGGGTVKKSGRFLVQSRP